MLLSKLGKYFSKILSLITFMISVIVFVLLVYRFGFPQSESSILLIVKAFDAMLVIQWFSITLRLLVSGDRTTKKNRVALTVIYIFFTVVTVAMLSLQFKLLDSDHLLSLLTSSGSIMLSSLLIAIAEFSRVVTNFLGKKTNPAMLIAVSFALVIFIGSILLGLPNCSVNGISYIDSLFVSASAVCVTGLTPIDISSTLTFTGQVVLLGLIQAGGLGIMTLTSFFGLFFVSGSFSNQLVVRDLISSDKVNGLLKYALKIVGVTLTVEAIGAILIYLAMIDQSDLRGFDAVWFSIFHAVSAFCNAGFSTLSGNLYDPAVREISSVIWVISWLVVFGGIGFPIFNNFLRTIMFKLRNVFRQMFGLRKIVIKHLWQLNTRIVVSTTAFLLIFGWAFFLIVEWNNSLAIYDFWDKLAQGFLMAVTPRTAGFSGVDIGSMVPASIFVTIILMWIGGAPQSTAGGIKVTTIYLAIRNIYSGTTSEDHIDLMGREIPSSSIRRAFSVIVSSLLVIGVSVTILALLEPTVELSRLIFEAFSALGTVGVSMGVTPGLGTASKVVVIILMFVGRVGIMSILLSLIKRNDKRRLYSLPEENILIN